MAVYLADLRAAAPIIIIFFDPGTQFPGKKNYAMQRQNTKYILLLLLLLLI